MLKPVLLKVNTIIELFILMTLQKQLCSYTQIILHIIRTIVCRTSCHFQSSGYLVDLISPIFYRLRLKTLLFYACTFYISLQKKHNSIHKSPGRNRNWSMSMSVCLGDQHSIASKVLPLSYVQKGS